MQYIALEILWFVIAILLGIVAILLVIAIFFFIKVSIKFLMHQGKNYHLRKTKPIFIKTQLAIRQCLSSINKTIYYYTGVNLTK